MIDNTVVVSTPPHVKSKRTTKGIMLDVLIALLPCAVAGIVFFDWMALVIELVAIVSCVATEFVYFFIMNKGFSNKCADASKVCRRWLKQFDFTSVISGLILALILPVTVKWYEVIIGGIFTIAVVKMLFGGTGKNLVNPAAAGRVFMFISFSIVSYTACKFNYVGDSGTLAAGATNLSTLLGKNPSNTESLLDLFLGSGIKGCIGETCALAILAGYVYLAARQVIKWWQPLLFLAVFGLVAVFMSGFGFEGGYKFDITLFLPHILSGGVLFAAVFMFTDYVTSPKNVWAQLVYFAVSAAVLAIMRYLTGVEVASFIILIMNLFLPLIDKYIIPRPFGYKKEKKVKEGK